MVCINVFATKQRRENNNMSEGIPSFEEIQQQQQQVIFKYYLSILYQVMSSYLVLKAKRIRRKEGIHIKANTRWPCTREVHNLLVFSV